VDSGLFEVLGHGAVHLSRIFDGSVSRGSKRMYEELRKIDFKLLIALEVLLEERSVTKAARRLSLSQPASNS